MQPGDVHRARNQRPSAGATAPWQRSTFRDMSSLASVFERLGPLKQAEAEPVRNQQVKAVVEPKHRVALAHLLISRALRERERDSYGCVNRGSDASRSSGASHGLFAAERRQQVWADPPWLQQLPVDAGLQEQLRRLQTEREAQVEVMMHQTQALLQDKQQLQACAAALVARKAQLEERLDYFLGEHEEAAEQKWAEEGALYEAAPFSSCGRCRPGAPNTASLEDVAVMLHSKLDALADDQQAHEQQREQDASSGSPQR